MRDKEKQVVFDQYAKYYNLLYKDKNYREEVDFIMRIITDESPRASTVLDLGCGTGKHDLLFVERGFSVTGVDLSEQMIAIAGMNANERLRFIRGDARTVRLERKYDVVVALFHVMSYQIGNRDIQSVLDTASRHLDKGGLFIFDCWYGPGVLTDRPATRIKRLEDEGVKLVRLSEAEMDATHNKVDVSFDVFITDKLTGEQRELKEIHSMRYLFYPEVALMAESSGFTVSRFEEWLTGRQPDYTSWNVVFCCKKIECSRI
jgi:SAM-dependent methyltransferase